MSNVHAAPTESAKAALKHQQKISTIVSLIMALLIMALLTVLLAIIFMVTKTKEIPTIVTYSANSAKDEAITRPKIKTTVSRKPSSPSSAMSRVIAANAASPTAIPVPEFDVPEPSTDYGNGDDFGDGWAEADFGDSGGTASFFGQEVRAQRLAYVIDYSQSMKAQNREGLMREELADSLTKMQPGMQLGMIFFAGPAWAAGGSVKGTIVHSSKGKEYKWKRVEGAHNSWEHDGRKEKVAWIKVSPPQVKKYQKIVKETKLTGGTVWDNPLHMALDMDPPPQMIYFMTDGAASGSAAWAKDVGDRAAEMGVVINCVAMMVPRAVQDLKDLADRTGGQLTIVKEDGQREIVDDKHPLAKKTPVKKKKKKPKK